MIEKRNKLSDLREKNIIYGIQHSIQIIIDIIYVYTHIWIVYVYIMKKVSVFPNPYHLYECVCMINV